MADRHRYGYPQIPAACTHLAGFEPATSRFVGVRSIQIELQVYSGQGWTRTNVGRNRRIYSPLQLPLCDLPLLRIF